MDVSGKGLQQRIRALNLFIQDIYNDQSHKDKIIPKELILSSFIFEAVRRLYAAKDICVTLQDLT
jgi:uncharacterized circularly permuted ATP-grasp superfamily protein